MITLVWWGTETGCSEEWKRAVKDVCASINCMDGSSMVSVDTTDTPLCSSRTANIVAGRPIRVKKRVWPSDKPYGEPLPKNKCWSKAVQPPTLSCINPAPAINPTLKKGKKSKLTTILISSCWTACTYCLSPTVSVSHIIQLHVALWHVLVVLVTHLAFVFIPHILI